jgi:hypothetical protein
MIKNCWTNKTRTSIKRRPSDDGAAEAFRLHALPVPAALLAIMVLPMPLGPTRTMLVAEASQSRRKRSSTCRGVYALLANLVRWRAHEIGVRRALGAPRGHLLRLLGGRGVAITLAGSACGLVAVAALAPVARSVLSGAVALDPVLPVAVVCLFVVIALAASLLPARRALRLEPPAVLRAE